MEKKPSERINELYKVFNMDGRSDPLGCAIAAYLDERWEAEQKKANSSFTDHLLNITGSNAE